MTHDYITEGGRVVAEFTPSATFVFSYDDNGLPYSFTYNGTQYYYITNQQGDVLEIRDGSNTRVAQYKYNAWGELLSSSGTMASINPLRYRGYYYDSETGLYYLLNRYYDPVICRFINADDTEQLGANEDFASLNLFAYCGNNPVTRTDSGGQFWHLIVGGVIGGIIGAVSSAVSGGDVADILIGAVAGAAGGVLAASGAGAVAQAVGSAFISMASNAASQVNHIVKDKTGKTGFDVGDMLFDGAVGLVFGIRGGEGAAYGNSKSITQYGKRFMREFFLENNSRAWVRYSKSAHAQGGKFVIDSLKGTFRDNVLSSFLLFGKSVIKEYVLCNG